MAHCMHLFYRSSRGNFNNPTALARVDYPWDSLPAGTRVCDIGGGRGHVVMALLGAHPHLRVVVQDLPSVIDEAKKVCLNMASIHMASIKISPFQVWQADKPNSLKDGQAALVPLDFFAETPVPECDFYYVRIGRF